MVIRERDNAAVRAATEAVLYVVDAAVANLDGGRLTLSTNRTCARRSVTAQSTWKKSTPNMLVTCVRRNRRQVLTVCRNGAGGIPRRLRIRRIIEAPTRWPSLTN